MTFCTGTHEAGEAGVLQSNIAWHLPECFSLRFHSGSGVMPHAMLADSSKSACRFGHPASAKQTLEPGYCTRSAIPHTLNVYMY